MVYCARPDAHPVLQPAPLRRAHAGLELPGPAPARTCVAPCAGPQPRPWPPTRPRAVMVA